MIIKRSLEIFIELFAYCYFSLHVALQAYKDSSRRPTETLPSPAPVSGQFDPIRQICFSCREGPRPSCGPGCFGETQMAEERGRAASASVYLNSHSVQGQESRSAGERGGQSKHPENLLTSNALLKRGGGQCCFLPNLPSTIYL